MNSEQQFIYEQIRKNIGALGYRRGHLIEKYTFVDPLGDDLVPREIPMAAFAHLPPDYSNACIGVVFANGRGGAENVNEYGSLGAPMIFEVYTDRVVRYQINHHIKPITVETIAPDRLTNAFAENREAWGPARILQAKGQRSPNFAIQLDFVDAGLMPALEGVVQRKLNKLLRELIERTSTEYQARHGVAPHLPELFRLIFRLLAAKVLHDRNPEDDWGSSDVTYALRNIQEYYGANNFGSEPILDDIDVAQNTWNRLRSSFHFQNLSADDLAYVYENTLITSETRKKYGIHSTPPRIAEHIVTQLPFESISRDERIVLEPFSGHSIFLIAAMRRLRELLPNSWGSKRRHRYFVQMLRGIERDDFAREVARLSLMLADYPNPDGWQLHGSDVFSSGVLNEQLRTARIILCNPPFENFKDAENREYGRTIRRKQKPAEILDQVLDSGPTMLGFVMPRAFLHGSSYRDLRDKVGRLYGEVGLVALPGGIFQHSDAESVLVTAHSPNPSKQSVRVFGRWVGESDRGEFLKEGLARIKTNYEVHRPASPGTMDIWRDPLTDVWSSLSANPKLGDLARIHRGIEWSIAVSREENRRRLISGAPRSGFELGLDTARGKLSPYQIESPVYLNTTPSVARGNAYKYPWKDKKVILNAATASRGPWRVIAAPDHRGLVCYQRLHGVWPKTKMPITALAAILNNPLANAYMYFHEGRRDNRITTLKSIPVPFYELLDTNVLVERVTEYISLVDVRAESWQFGHSDERALSLLLEIDSIVLKAYDLSPKQERMVLDLFQGYSRPVPVPFTNYFPVGFNPFVPLHEYLSSRFTQIGAAQLAKRIDPISDPAVHEILADAVI